MRLETFKERLPVVESGHGRRERHGAEGLDARVMPRAVAIVGDKHVIAVVGAEGGILAKLFGEAGF